LETNRTAADELYAAAAADFERYEILKDEAVKR
jgi:hypothetical protein